MNLLLDTHVLIWLINGDETLILNTRQIIDQTCQEHSLCVSAISIREIAMLNAKNRITLNQPLRQWIDQVTSLPFIKIIPVDMYIALESCELPHAFHGDPADRIIVATARILNIPLMTRDQKIINYGINDYLKVIMA